MFLTGDKEVVDGGKVDQFLLEFVLFVGEVGFGGDAAVLGVEKGKTFGWS